MHHMQAFGALGGTYSCGRGRGLPRVWLREIFAAARRQGKRKGWPNEAEGLGFDAVMVPSESML